jgi:PIN domain nuclease of toxin-antitoxin system
MRILLDTHTLLWIASSNSTLSQTANNLIVDPANVVYVSIVSLWEIAIKVSIGKLNLGKTFEKFVEENIENSNLTVLGVTLQHTKEVANLPLHHRDPFDRMLIAQAITEGLTVVSRDNSFDLYNVNRVW